VNPLYPVYLKLAKKAVLVVGGGSVGLRRVERLLEARARVTVVSPELVPELEHLSNAGVIECKRREFATSDMDGAHLVFAQTGNRELLDLLRAEASRRGVLLCAADDEAFSDFHVPAVLERGNVKIAVSSGGVSPSGAAKIRDAIESWLSQNEHVVQGALDLGRTATTQDAGGWDAPPPKSGGKVYLVGAGPGDPGLLTLRAAELLNSADVLYYDRLISHGILERIPSRVKQVYVGKEVGCATRPNISELMVASARAGKTVVRLKGGDPLLFGRGGEEMIDLRKAGVDFELVPGVSALNAVPGAAGIPLTHRDIASEVVIRSGHGSQSLHPGGSKRDSGISTRTYVYFMPASRLEQIIEELKGEGLQPSTPVAVIQNGTLPDQQVFVGNVGELTEMLKGKKLETPALFVAGEVVRNCDLQQLIPLLEQNEVK
jgi:uroporphyrin-III C-methyltransferase/precorrin-2 dehydrogenase/sirohydrochlorin ferrochelatase